MVRHTKHFHPKSDKKLVCSCCGKGTLAIATFIVLEVVRVHFGVPVTINSACRCRMYNEKIGGSKNSKHLCDVLETTAADIVVEDVPPYEVYLFLCSLPYANLLGLGDYSSFTHIDTRGYKARW
jgi:uncharacterized protein YcbK (DUF882 family)